jgi:photosystem II stability/assembly factor-like uncharacterized protein
LGANAFQNESAELLSRNNPVGRNLRAEALTRQSDERERPQTTKAEPEKSYDERYVDSDGERFDNAEAAAEYNLQKRLPAGATQLPVERYQIALDHMSKMAKYSTAGNPLLPPGQKGSQATPEASLGTWSNLGPGNVGGRTRSIAIDPTNPNTIFAGAVTGGVWKSTNGGASWFPTSDLMANLNVSTLAMDPGDAKTLYAGTGEQSTGWPGNGIFKSTDSGISWNQLPATANNSNFSDVSRVVVSPGNSQRVYAATDSGVWRSTDGGTSWTQVLVPSGCTDLAIRTDVTGKASDYLFAACGVPSQTTIYRNTNANGSGPWDMVLTEANMGRSSVAFAPSNQNTVYVLSSDLTGPYGRGSLHAVFRSTTGGGTGSWTARVRNNDAVKINTLLLSYCDGSGSQGYYDQTIAVDPVNENRVWVGGIDLYRSDDCFSSSIRRRWQQNDVCGQRRRNFQDGRHDGRSANNALRLFCLPRMRELRQVKYQLCGYSVLSRSAIP